MEQLTFEVYDGYAVTIDSYSPIYLEDCWEFSFWGDDIKSLKDEVARKVFDLRNNAGMLMLKFSIIKFITYNGKKICIEEGEALDIFGMAEHKDLFSIQDICNSVVYKKLRDQENKKKKAEEKEKDRVQDQREREEYARLKKKYGHKK